MSLALLEVLRRSTAYLAARDDETARLDAELLLGSVLGLRRLDLYLQFERPMQPGELERLRPLLRSRSQGCPTAYLVGEREFMGLAFSVSPAVLIPRPETEQLVERALAVLAARPPGATAPRVADLGTGSGCIAVALAHHHLDCTVDAVDRSPAALQVAVANIGRHHLEQRVRIWEGDWAEPLWPQGGYDLVVANPPYVTSAEMRELPHTVAGYEPAQALDGGADGLAAYRSLLGGVLAILAPGATVLLEVDPRRADQLADLCARRWPAAELSIRPDLAGRLRVLELRCPGGAPAVVGTAAAGA
ncbi:MAG TPA: peptide chain release factor N(5)-glutamine methyltransferase [Verrucomicrobiae bacterium]|nr:peptide chain release factor N(5)-glutamine methyltransferase [Verrucomicrobiae bacterium]